jgi:hypothetical protein
MEHVKFVILAKEWRQQFKASNRFAALENINCDHVYFSVLSSAGKHLDKETHRKSKIHFYIQRNSLAALNFRI